MTSHAEPMEFDVSRKLADSVGDMLGAELVAARDGWSLVRLQVEERHLNSFGFVNGTVGFALCDIGMGSAIATEMLKRKTSSATVEIKINYLKSVRRGVLECESRAVHLGSGWRRWSRMSDATETWSSRPRAPSPCSK